MVLFLSPVDANLQVNKCILSMFEMASGLVCNLGKCQIVPICCNDSQVQLMHDLFSCPITEFSDVCPPPWLIKWLTDFQHGRED
jgi:hypothetical protein